MTEFDRDKTTDLLFKLCEREQLAEESPECWRPWLTLGLLWLCHHQRFLSDPLFFAEDLVDELSGSLERRLEGTTAWLRFMPPNPSEWDPGHHTFAENYERLMTKWRDYLDRYAGLHLKDYEAVRGDCRKLAPARKLYNSDPGVSRSSLKRS